MVFIRLSCFCSRFFLYSIFLEYFLFFPVIDHNMTHFYLSFESQVLRLDVKNNWLWRWKNWEESSRAWSFFSHAREYLKNCEPLHDRLKTSWTNFICLIRENISRQIFIQKPSTSSVGLELRRHILSTRNLWTHFTHFFGDVSPTPFCCWC